MMDRHRIGCGRLSSRRPWNQQVRLISN